MAVQEFQHQHRVAYAECTVGNHVYYSRYLDMLEEARGELFRQAGCPLLSWQEQDTAFPVISVEIAYKGPARYDDLLTIQLWIAEMAGLRLTFGFRIQHATGATLAQGETRHICATLDEKPKRLPVGLAERLAPFLRVSGSCE
ncbi:MAG TPA: acyl-CoA thioesterase [Verrucomicrobiae bacterium]|jgi:acyl-CoA thioester hydrolase